jgi:hypothetical protein
VKFDIPTVVHMKITTFWDAALCSMVEVYRSFGRICCLLLQGRTVGEAERGVMFQIIGPDIYTAFRNLNLFLLHESFHSCLLSAWNPWKRRRKWMFWCPWTGPLVLCRKECISWHKLTHLRIWDAELAEQLVTGDQCNDQSSLERIQPISICRESAVRCSTHTV